jgi:hypothetical protein
MMPARSLTSHNGNSKKRIKKKGAQSRRNMRKRKEEVEKNE